MSNTEIIRLKEIMARLRDPKDGCAWDLKQNFETVKEYTIEEAYEVADAIEQNDMDMLKSELGDLLLQVIFHSQMADELGLFNFEDVAKSVSDKMVDRHPHIFGDVVANDAETVLKNWEDIKEQERISKGEQKESALDGVALGLPSLLRAGKLLDRASRVGFNWNNIDGIFNKITEEIEELKFELEAKNIDKSKVSEELGDVFIILTKLARWLDLNPESVVRDAGSKFERRFKSVEAKLKEQGKSPSKSELEEMDRLWNVVKLEEKEEAKVQIA